MPVGTITALNVKREYGFITSNLQEFFFSFADAPAIVLMERGRQVEFTPRPPRIAGRLPTAGEVRPL
ncbi:MAG: hypothetical protein ACT4QC_02295 [Planctomycetaceae bacterium]